MLNGTWDTFLKLLRAGLWEQDLQLSAVPDAAGWEQLMRMARSQSVMGLFLRGMVHLPDDQQPPGAVQQDLLRWRTALERTFGRHARVQALLLEELSAAGVHPVVQKGSEAAKYYPRPAMRQVGDIDLYCPEFARARALVPEARRAPDGAAVFEQEGVTVELHPHYYDVHLPLSRLPEPGTPCGELLLLSAHIFKHAIGAGVGYKQLCDLTLALTRLDGQYDKAELQAALQRAGLLRWHRLVCSLLVEDLGLDPACCLDDFCPCNPQALRRIIREGGSFGKNHRQQEREKTPLQRKAAIAGTFLRRLPFSLRFGARETLSTLRELIRGNLQLN